MSDPYLNDIQDDYDTEDEDYDPNIANNYQNQDNYDEDDGEDDGDDDNLQIPVAPPTWMVNGVPINQSAILNEHENNVPSYLVHKRIDSVDYTTHLKTMKVKCDRLTYLLQHLGNLEPNLQWLKVMKLHQ